MNNTEHNQKTISDRARLGIAFGAAFIGILIAGLSEHPAVALSGTAQQEADAQSGPGIGLETAGGSLLVVSQFTLYADTKSRRPGFTGAAKPDIAIPLYERFMAACRERGFAVEHGEFGADMAVASVNDGPVTIWFDTDSM